MQIYWLKINFIISFHLYQQNFELFHFDGPVTYATKPLENFNYCHQFHQR